MMEMKEYRISTEELVGILESRQRQFWESQVIARPGEPSVTRLYLNNLKPKEVIDLLCKYVLKDQNVQDHEWTLFTVGQLFEKSDIPNEVGRAIFMEMMLSLVQLLGRLCPNLSAHIGLQINFEVGANSVRIWQ